jgi:arginine repressor
MAKRIMKLTDTLAIVKVVGTGSETIALGVDLLPTTQIVSGTPTVGIGFIQWTCGTSVTVARGGVNVMELHTNEGSFDLAGNGGMLDTQNGTSDLVVTIAGGGTVFITLRKMSGYASKIEPEKFGQYDDPTAVGS